MTKKKHSQSVMTRDPQVTNRDPVIEPRGPIPAIPVPLIKCPHCGEPGPWRQGGTTTPNPLTKQMVRWRECVRCHKTHNQVWPMTPREIARYCAPEVVKATTESGVLTKT